MTARIDELANQASEAIRELNHLTYRPGTLPVPQAYTVIAEMATLTDRLGQLLDQLAANLTSRHHQGGLRLDASVLDRYTSIDAAIPLATAALANAAETAGGLHRALNEVQTITATIADHSPTEANS